MPAPWLPKADKAGVVAALAAAAQTSQARPILVPCSAESVNWVVNHGLSVSRVSSAQFDAEVADEQWAPPRGALVILDDADQVSPQTLRGAMAAAGETNSKLVMITGAMSEPTPGRALVAVLQENPAVGAGSGSTRPVRRAHRLSTAAATIAAAPDGLQAAPISEILDERDSLIAGTDCTQAPGDQRTATTGVTTESNSKTLWTAQRADVVTSVRCTHGGYWGSRGADQSTFRCHAQARGTSVVDERCRSSHHRRNRCAAQRRCAGEAARRAGSHSDRC